MAGPAPTASPGRPATSPGPPAAQPARPAALLLTGGASRRMGRDKATLEIGGVQLASRTADLLLQVAGPVVEVGPGFTSLPRVQEHPAGSGPLAAMAAGATAVGSGRPVLVVATDLPHLTAAFLRRLADEEVPTADHCVVPRDRDGRAQPLCARYSAGALAVAQELVATGHRSMKDLLERVPIIFVDADADTTDAVRDIDTPADLAALTDSSSDSK
jgi:molybdenum cofactor guanylyltransferase